MAAEAVNQPNEEDLFAQRAIADIMSRGRERGTPVEILSPKLLKNQTENLLRLFEDSRSHEEESMFEWPLLHSVAGIYERASTLKIPKNVIVAEFAAEATNEEGWYIGVSPEYGLQRKWKDVSREAFRSTDEMGKIIKSWSVVEHALAIRLGEDPERRGDAEKITKYAEEARARIKEASLWHYYIQHIEDIGGLVKFYFLANPITPRDLERTWNASFVGGEQLEEYTSEGGITFEKERTLGQMKDVAMRIFEAIGLSEKPKYFKNLMKLPGWKKIIGGSLSEKQQQEIFIKYFGDPDRWMAEDKRTEETYKSEGGRGLFTEFGNMFVRAGRPDKIRLIRERMATFLGGSEAAKLAVEQAWRIYRVYGCASFNGSEWYSDGKGGWKVLTDMGGDSSDDMVKVINTRSYQNYYRLKSRGGGPAGSIERIKSYAVDVLRGTTFEDYELPNGEVLKNVSVNELMWKYGLELGEINWKLLPDRALIRPYLNMFMAAKGSDFGGGSFDKMTNEKILSPEEFLSPGFWHDLWRALDVGITPAVVYRGDMASYTADGEKAKIKIRDYKLEQVKAFLDGLLSTPLAKKWDSEKGVYGKVLAGGLISEEWLQKRWSERVITVANQAISGLKYYSKRDEIHRMYGVDI